MTLTDAIKNSAYQIGFNLVSVSRADPMKKDGERYREWCQAGYAADLFYMKREFPRRWVPQDLLPEVKSVVTFAVLYSTTSAALKSKRGYGKVARYAWGKDYHIAVKNRLEEWVKLLPSLAGRPVKTRILVDSSPLLEKAFAGRGGIGFIGKNSLIISRKLGSFIFLSEVLTDLELEEDILLPTSFVASIESVPLTIPSPLRREEKGEGGKKDPCGTCKECIRDCPTGALADPRFVDSRKCISYWTIENREEIPEEMRPQIKDWIFGCDICQEVCPYNVLSKKSKWKEFMPESGVGPYLSLLEVLSIKTDEEFKDKYCESPVMRARRSGLIRNACTVAANQKFEEAIPLLKERFETDSNPMVRSHASWALKEFR